MDSTELSTKPETSETTETKPNNPTENKETKYTPTINDIVFNYIEFMIPKEVLADMFKIKPLSYNKWFDAAYNLYSEDPGELNEFHYNLVHTKAYKEIKECLKKIQKIYNDPVEENKKKKIKAEYNKIHICYEELYYYDEIYIYARYIFNNIRKNGIKLKGGGIKHLKDMKNITLEEFKNIIREKIEELESNLETKF